jgi:hypothetical protein
MMSDNDRMNLMYMRSLKDAALAKWWNSLTDDDKDYAVSLLSEWDREMQAAKITQDLIKKISKVY